jgi:hypothetical protein
MFLRSDNAYFVAENIKIHFFYVWSNIYVCQLLNVQETGYDRQTEIHTA